MKTEQILHFSVEDVGISAHVTCTRYISLGGVVKFRVSYHWQANMYALVPFMVESPATESEAMSHAEKIREIFRARLQTLL